MDVVAGLIILFLILLVVIVGLKLIFEVIKFTWKNALMIIALLILFILICG